MDCLTGTVVVWVKEILVKSSGLFIVRDGV